MGTEQAEGESETFNVLSALAYECSRILMQFVVSHTKQALARSRYTRSGLCLSKRISIEVNPQVVPDLDAIVPSFIICERDRRDQEEAVATSAVVV